MKTLKMDHRLKHIDYRFYTTMGGFGGIFSESTRHAIGSVRLLSLECLLSLF